jgi:hypothetical protein
MTSRFPLNVCIFVQNTDFYKKKRRFFCLLHRLHIDIRFTHITVFLWDNFPIFVHAESKMNLKWPGVKMSALMHDIPMNSFHAVGHRKSPSSGQSRYFLFWKFLRFSGCNTTVDGEARSDRGSLSFITCQDQSRFCEKPSQNHIWDKRVAKNHTKALDSLVIYRLNIIETDFILD